MSTEKVQHEYGADEIQILEGLGSCQKASRNVYRKYIIERSYIIWYTRL